MMRLTLMMVMAGLFRTSAAEYESEMTVYPPETVVKPGDTKIEALGGGNVRGYAAFVLAVEDTVCDDNSFTIIFSNDETSEEKKGTFDKTDPNYPSYFVFNSTLRSFPATKYVFQNTGPCDIPLFWMQRCNAMCLRSPPAKAAPESVAVPPPAPVELSKSKEARVFFPNAIEPGMRVSKPLDEPLYRVSAFEFTVKSVCAKSDLSYKVLVCDASDCVYFTAGSSFAMGNLLQVVKIPKSIYLENTSDGCYLLGARLVLFTEPYPIFEN
eukprot:TRINITY_DN12799_c2_g1_i1.p1 TRINITY_DN12799_c2_g1~~TRINITY_DN12799_c2_g1_i1.p1  ORF type:complete len:295 (+),score=35.52 TRINITY_DN12799_c2_g1_i1:82-885(+)